MAAAQQQDQRAAGPRPEQDRHDTRHRHPRRGPHRPDPCPRHRGHRRCAARRHRRPGGGCGEGRRRPLRLRHPHDRRDRGVGRCGGGGDLHADRHPCRPDRAVLQARKGGLLRKADRPQPCPGARLSRRRRGDRGHSDGRFNRRFDPDFIALKAAIDDGRVGDVEMITIVSRDPGPPPAEYIRHSGGIFRDMTIHDFDVARWLLGEEVESVMAQGSVLTDPEIGKLGDYDSTNVILRTASGRQAIITNSRRATYGYDQRVEVLGSKGLVALRNTQEANIELASADGYRSPPLLNFFMQRYATAYENEIAAFVASVASGAAVPTTGHDGMMALALADAAVKSAAGGCAVTVSEVMS